ncbi:postacrosomal sheath WW domain-binding protein [Apodemus sylvaticus]|uniref:postacrosomal sheath WW domain-binding protein n=1 Tax=Apodemus sylvaticus TaxID=10129 RepID=UPI00224496CF|nr:postacrosomal sheath WW domain-binding protein [Apodemus sylvaticus]
MAVNQNHTVDRRGAAIPHGESLLKKCSYVDLSFPQSPSGSSLFSGTKRGALFLTSYRVIFVTSRSDNDPMLSFMMPFHLMNNCTVEQPIFGANYIKGTIQAAPDGGWEGSATFKIVFRKGGAINFAQLMAKAASAAAQGVPLRVASFWMGPLGIYVITGDRSMYPPQAFQVAYGAPPAGYGAPPVGYGAPPAGYGAPPAGYGAPPAGYGAPPAGYVAPPPRYEVLPPGYGAVRYGSPPPLYVATPVAYGVPPPGYGPPPGRYGSPPPGYEAPTVAYGAQTPRYVTTPMSSSSPPPGYEAPPMGYGTPSGRESNPPGSTALSVAQEAPPAGPSHARDSPQS